METLTAFDPIQVAPDTFTLPAFMPIPGLGVLPMHSFVVRAAEPILIDTGPGPLAADFVQRLARVIDPGDLRYVWLTHTDPDHIGALAQVLEAAPQARVVTTFLGVGKLGLGTPLSEGRAFLLNPGQRLDLGDRTLRALLPPVFDAPETIAAFDERSGALFAADCFGTLMDAPQLDVDALPQDALRDGMLTWASVDAPWLQHVSADALRRGLASLQALEPSVVLSAHAPRAVRVTARLVDALAGAAGREPFVGPDQAALEALANVA